MADTHDTKCLQRLKDLQSSGRFSANYLDHRGLCHLHYAALKGFLLCAKWLVKHGGSLTLRSAEGSVPAHYAAAGGHLEFLKWIYKRAARSISILDYNGATPLYFAAQEGHLNCLVWLTKHSGTVHSQLSMSGMTAVHVTSQEGYLECLEFLVGTCGCSGLARDQISNTPLHYAAAPGRRACVEWILGNSGSLGNETNKNGSSPLHLAAQNGHLEVVKVLVRGGAAIGIRDRLGRTAYDVSIESGNEACAVFLYQAEARNRQVSRALSGNHNLKRVRFERKVIERDTALRGTPESVDTERKTLKQQIYSLYRNNRTNSDVLNGLGSRVDPPNGYRRPRLVPTTSQLCRRYVSQSPQGQNNSVTDLRRKRHPTTFGLLPWSRVYRMTSSADNAADRYQQNVLISRPLSGENEHQATKQHFTGSRKLTVITSEQPLPIGQNSSLISRIFLRRRNKKRFPSDIAHFDDVVNDDTRERSVFKRFYKFSKHKLTKSSSFVIERVPEAMDSFVVTGQDDFLLNSVEYQTTDTSSEQQRYRTRNHNNDLKVMRSRKHNHTDKDNSKELEGRTTELRVEKLNRERHILSNESGILNENGMIW